MRMKTIKVPARIVQLLLLMMLSACQSSGVITKEPALSTPPVNAIYPALGVFYKTPSDQQRLRCDKFQQSANMNTCFINGYDLAELSKSVANRQLFSHVKEADHNTDYQLLVSIAHRSAPKMKDMGIVALSGLMLVPASVQTVMEVEAVLTWRQIPIDVFEYTIPYEKKISALHSSEKNKAKFLDILTEKIMDSVDLSQSFSQEKLYDVLQASNYSTGMMRPNEFGDYIFENSILRADPMLGVQFRYQHGDFEFDKFDIFIYPIRNTSWQNKSALVEEEISNIRGELQLLADNGVYADIDFNEYENFNVDIASGQFLQGEVTDLQGYRYRVQTAVFIKQDKFVIMRSSNPVSDKMPLLGDFWKKFLQQIDPPPESKYMARIRDQARQEFSVRN